MVQDPRWTRDELILVCDEMRKNDWLQIRETDPRAAELSALLRELPIHPPETRSPKFRSVGSVSRKSANIVTALPEHDGSPTSGSKLDRVVLADFLHAPEAMSDAAAAIRNGFARVGSGNRVVADISFVHADVEFAGTEVREGRLLAAQHFRRERDPKLRADKIEEFCRTNQRVRCEVCGFDFEEVYGPRGAGFIECHHIVPLSVSGETKTRLSDLILLCSNCHRMIHRGPRWLEPDELRAMLATVPSRAAPATV
ncbi:HNH endonuclease [Nocardia puris]|uniref:5-methylcytosine-specific restriction protein A n=1 Tax=Nocardia puris TaxID=208602 RepID=A0A366E3A2_9NOCA|nr:HNH endonuclease [Nocardia puris]RBO96851.1 5-methylcytosine-specific restriction protein A [Nocardia puris]